MPPSRSEVTSVEHACRRLLDSIKRLKRVERERDKYKARVVELEAEILKLEAPTLLGEER